MNAEICHGDIIVFRACLWPRSADLSGEGASHYGGRWNAKGQAVVYTSENRPLALLEIRVHYPCKPIEAAGMMVLRLCPGQEIQTVSSGALPDGWRRYDEEGIGICQRLGSDWLNLETEKLEFDPRLWPDLEKIERRPANVMQLLSNQVRMRK